MELASSFQTLSEEPAEGCCLAEVIGGNAISTPSPHPWAKPSEGRWNPSLTPMGQACRADSLAQAVD